LLAGTYEGLNDGRSLHGRINSSISVLFVDKEEGPCRATESSPFDQEDCDETGSKRKDRLVLGAKIRSFPSLRLLWKWAANKVSQGNGRGHDTGTDRSSKAPQGKGNRLQRWQMHSLWIL
jgi:hypothetical protein